MRVAPLFVFCLLTSVVQPVAGKEGLSLEAIQKYPALTGCSDLKMELTVTKRKDGSVRMDGVLSNVGPGAYSSDDDPLEVAFYVDTRYPPKTYNQCAIKNVYGRTVIGPTLKPGEKREFTFLLDQPGFARWSKFRPGKNEREVKKLITAVVSRKTGTAFSDCEDMNEKDTHAWNEISYFERVE